jgi:hypothetical protein
MPKDTKPPRGKTQTARAAPSASHLATSLSKSSSAPSRKLLLHSASHHPPKPAAPAPQPQASVTAVPCSLSSTELRAALALHPHLPAVDDTLHHIAIVREALQELLAELRGTQHVCVAAVPVPPLESAAAEGSRPPPGKAITVRHMDDLLHILRIPADLIGYDAEADEFLQC